jgi:hypothetical protein
LSIPHFYFNRIERTWRWTIKHIARAGIERPFMTRAFKPLVFARIVNRTTQVRAFLAIRVIRAVGGANQDGRITFGRIIKIEAAVRRQRLGSFNASWSE